MRYIVTFTGADGRWTTRTDSAEETIELLAANWQRMQVGDVVTIHPII